ncbi:MAG: hypothetical protein Hyperionvirus1_71 [Hyperionvirus sp.]|uniref:Uncharacterized protein n=1 Tax=Hyperionvirus sp. TaxID=2487770 RepID=A0A3G5A644_9VIRU|nr:MAG: hypothetical protein Hyperionvirus1_71 [Hyperionvirus sp.]
MGQSNGSYESVTEEVQMFRTSMPVPIGEFTFRKATPSELKRWSRYIFIDDKLNHVLLSDSGFDLLNSGDILKHYEKEFKMIVRTLLGKKANGAEIKHPVIRYYPQEKKREDIASIEIPINIKEKNWFCYQTGFIKIHRQPNLEKVLDKWDNYVFIDELTQKVKLSKIGELMLLKGDKLHVDTDELFREIIAYLLMKKGGGLDKHSSSRMESIMLTDQDSAVRQLSVELLPPKSLISNGIKIEKSAIVQLRQLFTALPMP